MRYYEIKNTKTNETYAGCAKTFVEVCKAKDWKPQDCKCIWKANKVNACEPTRY